VTEEGRQIDESDEHPKNAAHSIDEWLESKVAVERDRHSPKQWSPSFVTDDGMQSDESDEHCAKPDCSIHERLLSNPIVTVERDQYHSKQCSLSFVIE
jgi:hypothetical protein